MIITHKLKKKVKALKRKRESYSDEIAEVGGDDVYGIFNAVLGQRHLLLPISPSSVKERTKIGGK